MKKKVVSLLLAFVMIFTIAQPAMAYAQVGMNSRGNDVKVLQNMLNTVDNAKLVPDGIFGTRTKNAVVKFQRNNGLAADGICGPKTWEKLAAKYNAIITPPASSGTGTPPVNASSYPMVQNGSSGTAVKTLQTMLNAVQNAGLSTDGIFGTKTKSAVIAFQRASGLAADGICGPKTWGALLARYNPAPAPTPSAISIGSGNYNPGTLLQGKTYSISGTITSTYSLNSVTVGIYYGDGSATNYVQIAYPRTTSYNIHSVDSYIRFGLLPAGNYYFRVTAADSNGTTKQLVNNSFTVSANRKNPIVVSGLKDVPGCAQEKSYCTSCAITTMLRRKQFVDGKTITFNLEDVRVSSGCPANNPLRDNPHFKMEGTWTDVYSVSSGAHSSYTTKSVRLSGDFTTKKRQLAQLLDQHPEGVVFYAKYPGSIHAITVSDYEIKSDGDYQFYAYDPINVRDQGLHRIRMENTYLCSRNGSLSQTFSNLNGITYIVS